MTIHFQRAIERIKTRLLVLSTKVEESVRHAVESVELKDAERAQQVIDGDDEIDDMEVEVEEECLKILALHQPVATDLRFLIAVLKINNDLERVGDLAVNIAERSQFLAKQAKTQVFLDFPSMADKVQWMLQRSLDALVNTDPDLAREVCLADDEVDAMNRQMYGQVQEGIKEDVGDVETLIHLLSISRHLERIADLATNIAEDVIYMADGQIVRHRVEQYVGRSAEAARTK